MNEELKLIEASVQDRFARVAREPGSEQVFAVGPDSAKRLGYHATEADSLPLAVTESFAGVGNPLQLGELRDGQIVLDLGCGAGFDSILAARRVAFAGKVIGVDFTPAMIEKARSNAKTVGVGNAEFHVARADALPLQGASVDVLITNGVFNLCVEKQRVVGEMFRVLKPGGSLRMADMLLEPHVTPEEVATKGTWSDWIAGALSERSLLKMLEEAGFVDARLVGWTGFRTSPYTQGALVVAAKPNA